MKLTGSASAYLNKAFQVEYIHAPVDLHGKEIGIIS